MSATMKMLLNLRAMKATQLLVPLAAALVFPLVFPNPAITTIAFYTLVYIAAAVAWNMFSGYTGYISLGHGTFFGIGAYTIAIASLDWHLRGGFGIFLLLPLAGIVTALVAAVVGWVALRTRGNAFAVMTLYVFFIFQLFAFNLQGLTNGSIGLTLPIPTFDSDWFNLPFYYIMLAIVVLALATSWLIRNSKYGLGLLAIRDDEDHAEGLGVQTGRSKLIALVISAFFTGIVGAMYAYFVGSIYPEFVFDPVFDIGVVLMVFLGGTGTLWGPILGALIVEPASQYFVLAYGQAGYFQILFGGLFLVIVLLLPEGIVGSVKRRWTMWKAAHDNDTLPGENAVQAQQPAIIERG